MINADTDSHIKDDIWVSQVRIQLNFFNKIGKSLLFYLFFCRNHRLYGDILSKPFSSINLQ